MRHYADENIFPDELFTHPAAYKKAAGVYNNDGARYREYGIHDEKYDIDAVFFDGYRNTKVFAYLGIPKGKAGLKKPAVILLHGGLGKAEINWVKKWNDRGFAAIAPDLYGDGPEEDKQNPYGTNQKRHPYAGVYPWDENAFLKDYKNAGMYQNTVTAIYAHNLLRALPDIDCSKIGVAGISWGGVTASIVAGVDSRLSFAIPIYGCGHIAESFTDFRNSICRPESTTKWDPAHFVSKARMPVLYINGNSDPFFSLNMTSETFLDTPRAQMAVYDGLAHSQEAGETISQAYAFAEKTVLENRRLPAVRSVSAANHKFEVKTEHADITDAVLYYHTLDDLQYKTGGGPIWRTVEEFQHADGYVVFDYPPEAVYGYATFRTAEEDCFSTPYIRLRPPVRAV